VQGMAGVRDAPLQQRAGEGVSLEALSRRQRGERERASGGWGSRQGPAGRPRGSLEGDKRPGARGARRGQPTGCGHSTPAGMEVRRKAFAFESYMQAQMGADSRYTRGSPGGASSPLEGANETRPQGVGASLESSTGALEGGAEGREVQGGYPPAEKSTGEEEEARQGVGVREGPAEEEQRGEGVKDQDIVGVGVEVGVEVESVEEGGEAGGTPEKDGALLVTQSMETLYSDNHSLYSDSHSLPLVRELNLSPNWDRHWDTTEDAPAPSSEAAAQGWHTWGVLTASPGAHPGDAGRLAGLEPLGPPLCHWKGEPRRRQQKRLRGRGVQ